jgi:hypothetical protein
MYRKGEETHVETDDARSGATNHGVRYVLGIGLALAIVALSFIWITGALTGPQTPGETPVISQSAN